jgi:fructose-1-phosphate kinase PfkB-like protein
VPFIIKPNLHEIGRMLDREVTGVMGAVSAADEMREKGISIVIVSMGGDGAVVVSDGTRLVGIPPKVEVVSTVGAGDSFLAAFVLGHSRDMNIKECLRLGVAAGAAASMTPGTELARKKDVDDILPRVKIEEVQ